MKPTKSDLTLVTGGCSFSQLNNADVTWPIHLTERIQPSDVRHTGRGAADNTTISRMIIHRVSELLGIGTDPENMLVGIMWSGADRHSVYYSEDTFEHSPFEPCAYATNSHGQEEACHLNPLNIASEQKHHYLVHPWWDDPSSRRYLKYFYDPVGAQIRTLENVLRVQWFLKSHNVKYFMTEFSWHSVHDHIAPGGTSPISLDHPDIKHLVSLIDQENWLPVTCMSGWVYENQIPYSRPKDDHPSTLAHQRFVDEVILPHLSKRNIL